MVFFVVLLFSIVALGMNVVQYIQMHKISDGGYLDTPTIVSRYGDLTQTIYMQRMSEEYGKVFVSPSYFVEYLNLLKDHSTYFKAPTWINYSVELSKYLEFKQEKPDIRLLNALDGFLAKNLKNYANTPSYYQILSDGLVLSKMLKKDVTKTDVYKTSLEVLKKAVSGHLYANAGLTVLSAMIENDLPFANVGNIKKFVSSNLSYLEGEYHTAFYLFKDGLLDEREVQSVADLSNVETPYQLYWYEQLCKAASLKTGNVEKTYESFLKERAPFGGFYDLGNYSSVRDTYWATKALKLFGKASDKNYWMNFVSNLVQTASAYPANVLARYIYYVLEVNDEYHILTRQDFSVLAETFRNKMQLSPALEAYYLATFNFDGAFETLDVIQRTNCRNTKVYSDVNTVLERLFNGLEKIKASKRDLSYYYDYVQLFNFAHDFGYTVSKDKVKDVEAHFMQDMKKASYTDLNLLAASLQLERNYELPFDKDFYVTAIEKLRDPKSGGYFYNTLDGRLTFKSIYTANEILDSLEQ